MSEMGNMLKMQQEAMKVKKELENTIIEAEIEGLVISVNGEMKVEKVDFETNELISKLDKKEKEKLENAILKSINKGLDKSKNIAAEKMQGIMGKMGMGDLNLPK